MPSKKRGYLQQFGIIHLPNPDLTYIRNSERETKLCLCPSTSWKIKSGTLLCYLFLFSPSHLTRNHDANRAPRAYIYALEAGFSQVAKNCQVFCQTVGGVFLTFLPKIKDDNSICQTLGDATFQGSNTLWLVPNFLFQWKLQEEKKTVTPCDPLTFQKSGQWVSKILFCSLLSNTKIK